MQTRIESPINLMRRPYCPEHWVLKVYSLLCGDLLNFFLSLATNAGTSFREGPCTFPRTVSEMSQQRGNLILFVRWKSTSRNRCDSRSLLTQFIPSVVHGITSSPRNYRGATRDWRVCPKRVSLHETLFLTMHVCIASLHLFLAAFLKYTYPPNIFTFPM